MKIGIDTRMIDNSGIGTYIKNLIFWLPKVSNYEYILFGDRTKLEKYNLPVIDADFPVYGVKEQMFFPNIIKKAKVDLFHFPHYTVPVLYSKKLVVTIHDLIHLIFPKYLPSKRAYFYAKFMISSACKKADRIIVVSENTRSDITKYFRINPEKIRVIMEGVSEIFHLMPVEKNLLKQKYGNYILYVGAIRPHKNIVWLIDAFCELAKRGIEHKLVLIGKGKISYIDEINEKIFHYALDKKVVMLEYVDDKQLAEFYSSADLFVFPSLYEGFGLPLLEAMACGCPVVCSNTSSLPEVVGDAAVLVNPNNIEELVNAIYKVIVDDNIRKNLVKKGLERTKMFSWKKMAEETLKIYKEVLQ